MYVIPISNITKKQPVKTIVNWGIYPASSHMFFKYIENFRLLKYFCEYSGVNIYEIIEKFFTINWINFYAKQLKTFLLF